MKKVLFMLMLMIGTAATFTSCKKDDEKTEKEKNLELLVSGKWYYQSYRNSGSSSAYTCFTAADYWEFKSDGTVSETWDFGNGTYSISEDGKTLSVTTGNYTNTFTITSISNSELKLNLAGSKSSADLSMAKTALNCTAK